MESLGHFFSSLLNMIGFTSNNETTNNDDDKNSSSSLKEKDETKEEISKTHEKKEESEETFTFIDVFEKEKDELYENVHDIFITNF